ncbi:MAG: GNAT family N-acetyltransferase [Planctomycetota bacterium]|nr:MAG: GNAT family N-acetyltransferase [Planctomycetota bacterium]
MLPHSLENDPIFEAISPVTSVRLLDQYGAARSDSPPAISPKTLRSPISSYLVIDHPGPPPAAIFVLRRRDGMLGLGPLIEQRPIDERMRALLWTAALDWAYTQPCTAIQIFTEAGSPDAHCLESLGQRATTEVLALHRPVTADEAVPWLQSHDCRPLPLDQLRTDGTITSLIAETFEGTLDLPEALPWRDIRNLVDEWTTDSADQLPAEVWMTGPPERPFGLIVTRHRESVRLIEYMGIARDYRRQGWGRRLLETVVSETALHGDQGLEVHVDIRNTPALALYLGMEFRIQRRAWLAFQGHLANTQPTPSDPLLKTHDKQTPTTHGPDGGP